MKITTGAGDDATSFSGVKVMWDMTGFNYPSTPFFTDVPPASPIFPYVQKMFELGITAGCGGRLYCPNSFLTRGQMGVFIIKSRYNVPW